MRIGIFLFVFFGLSKLNFFLGFLNGNVIIDLVVEGLLLGFILIEDSFRVFCKVFFVVFRVLFLDLIFWFVIFRVFLFLIRVFFSFVIYRIYFINVYLVLVIGYKNV